MLFETSTILRLCGMAGILGALVTGFGDLFYHHIPHSSQTPVEKMASLPLTRLVIAGILGLIGSWLYLLSAFHIYYAFLSVGVGFAFAASFSFAMVAIAYGSAHSAYYAIGSSAKVAAANNLEVESAGKMGARLFSRIVLITYVPVASSMLLMCYGILSSRSAYPRWMAVFLPIIPYLLRTPILKILRGRVQELIRDSYDNFVLLMFFVLSTIVLWH